MTQSSPHEDSRFASVAARNAHVVVHERGSAPLCSPAPNAASFASSGSASRGVGRVTRGSPNAPDSSVTPVNVMRVVEPATTYAWPSDASPVKDAPCGPNPRRTTLSHVLRTELKRWYTDPRRAPGAPAPGAPVNPRDPQPRPRTCWSTRRHRRPARAPGRHPSARTIFSPRFSLPAKRSSSSTSVRGAAVGVVRGDAAVQRGEALDDVLRGAHRGCRRAEAVVPTRNAGRVVGRGRAEVPDWESASQSSRLAPTAGVRPRRTSPRAASPTLTLAPSSRAKPPSNQPAAGPPAGVVVPRGVLLRVILHPFPLPT